MKDHRGLWRIIEDHGGRNQKVIHKGEQSLNSKVKQLKLKKLTLQAKWQQGLNSFPIYMLRASIKTHN